MVKLCSSLFNIQQLCLFIEDELFHLQQEGVSSDHEKYKKLRDILDTLNGPIPHFPGTETFLYQQLQALEKACLIHRSTPLGKEPKSKRNLDLFNQGDWLPHYNFGLVSQLALLKLLNEKAKASFITHACSFTQSPVPADFSGIDLGLYLLKRFNSIPYAPRRKEFVNAMQDFFSALVSSNKEKPKALFITTVPVKSPEPDTANSPFLMVPPPTPGSSQPTVKPSQPKQALTVLAMMTGTATPPPAPVSVEATPASDGEEPNPFAKSVFSGLIPCPPLPGLTNQEASGSTTKHPQQAPENPLRPFWDEEENVEYGS